MTDKPRAIFLDWRNSLDVGRRCALVAAGHPARIYQTAGIDSNLFPIGIRRDSDFDAVFEAHKPCFNAIVRSELASIGLGIDQISIVVPSGNARSQRKAVGCSVFGDNRPTGSFAQITEHIYLLTPEAVFYRMHFDRYLDFAQRVHIGMELCGTYAPVGRNIHDLTVAAIQETRSVLDMSPIKVASTVEREEITSVWKIEQYLDAIAKNNKKHRHNARHVLDAYATMKHVSQGAASPAESTIMCLCCLPAEYNGCGFSPAAFNVTIELDDESRRVLNKDSVRVDVCWDCFGLEADSYEWHAGRDELRKDALRRLVIQDGSFGLISVTYDQVKDDKAAELLMRRVAQNIKEPQPSQSHDAVQGRKQLRKLLLTDCTEW